MNLQQSAEQRQMLQMTITPSELESGVDSMIIAIIGQRIAEGLHSDKIDIPRLAHSVEAQREVAAILTHRALYTIGLAARDALMDIMMPRTDIPLNDIQERATTGFQNTFSELLRIATEEINHWYNHDWERYASYDSMPLSEDRKELKTDLPIKERSDQQYIKDMQPLLKLWEAKFPSNSRKLFAEVRNATYRVMTPDDAPHVAKLYNCALLDAPILDLLRDGQTDTELEKNIDAFRERMRTGVFINPMDAEELSRDLEKGLNRNPSSYHGQFRGRVLENGGDILAWLTYIHTPRSSIPLQTHESIVREYVTKGVTGKMKYEEDSRELNEEYFLRTASKTQLFQDIQGLRPFAAARLFALASEEMLDDNPNLINFMAYRLNTFDMEPTYQVLPRLCEISTFPLQNTKSNLFFFNRNCRDVAIDYNPNNPHKSPRKNIGGIDRYINPSWRVFRGVMKDVMKQSKKIWEGIQISHGDLSIDDYSENPPFGRRAS